MRQLPDNEDLVVLLDTGAVCPVIGVNSFLPGGDSQNSSKESDTVHDHTLGKLTASTSGRILPIINYAL